MTLITLLHQWWQGVVLNPFLLFVLLPFPLLYWLKLTRSHNHNLPPSPPKLPVIGNLHQLGTLPHQSLHALSKKYGPLMFLRLGSAPTLVVSSADIAKEIMRTHDIVFANRPLIRAADFVYYGCTDVGFSPYGEYWRQAKKIRVLELLSQRRMKSFQFVREEEVVNLVEKICGSCLSGATINLGEMFSTIASDIISRSVIGKKFEGEGGKRLGELTKRATELFGAFCFKDFFPSLGWIDVLTGLVSNLKETSNALRAYLDQVIDDHQTFTSNDHQSDRKDFVDILLHLQKDGMLDINLTQDNIKAILMDMFIGGTDTTSATMEWAMAELMKKPSIMKKVQEEVRRVVGKKSKLDESDIYQMEYLKCVIKETMRLHPPLPLLVPRESSASVKLEGYEMPPMTRVYINAWAIQKDPELWEKPEEFLPERFVNSPIDLKGHDFQFIPFGAGRRRCPGISYAIIEAEHILANLLYWFDWKLPSGETNEDLDMTEAYGIVVHKKIPLQLVPVLQSH